MNQIIKQILLLGGAAFATIGLLAGLSALFSVPTFYLWNGLMPKLFGLSSVTLLQAWGLNLLAGFMFGGRISKK